MKIAVFSDVHGNLGALKTVLDQISEKNVDQIVFLGDIFQRRNEEINYLELLVSHALPELWELERRKI